MESLPSAPQRTSTVGDAGQQALSQALTAFKMWRDQKTNPSTPIPGALWQQVFALEKHFLPKELRRYFNLTAQQYEDKKAVLLAGTSPPSAAHPTATPTKAPKQTPNLSLCEAKVKPEKPYELSPLPTGKTIIVEYYRDDGRCMKIHTTQESIPTLVKTFYSVLADVTTHR